MIRRLSFVCAALLTAAVLSAARKQLAGVDSPEMSVWPGHVIFGLYFAVLTLALQGLHRLWTERRGRPRQTLLVLALACVSGDFVLVNVQEMLQRADASYGLVVVWDMACFFIWLRAIDLADEDPERFFDSAVVSIAPALALGREILFLPYDARAERAYLDLVLGNMSVALWPVAVGVQESAGPRLRLLARICYAAVFAGCLYWLANAIENLLFLAWPPLPKLLYAVAERAHAPVYWLSVAYAAVAALATAAVCRFAPRLAARFGL
ncbi:MAG: hypothetical protein AB7M12_07180 [Hyphomonadaceae bacterium]